VIRAPAAVAGARRQFKNPEEDELPSLVSVTRRLVETASYAKVDCIM
jgi:hypothetical protein